MDLCLERTKGHYSKTGKDTVLTLDPVDVVFDEKKVTIQTVYTFTEGSSGIKLERKVLRLEGSGGKVMINEYITACYGTTEYSEDMTGIRLSLIKDGQRTESIDYEYKCREAHMDGADISEAVIPQVDTRLQVICRDREASGYVKEGYAFSPMFTLGFDAELTEGKVFTTWLSLQKAN